MIYFLVQLVSTVCWFNCRCLQVRTLFISGLPMHATEQDLYLLFLGAKVSLRQNITELGPTEFLFILNHSIHSDCNKQNVYNINSWNCYNVPYSTKDGANQIHYSKMWHNFNSLNKLSSTVVYSIRYLWNHFSCLSVWICVTVTVYE